MKTLRLVAGAVILAWAVLAGVGAAPAHAHSELVSANPAQGSRLDAVPTQVTLTFSTGMKAPATVAVTAPDGTGLLAGTPTVAGSTVTATLKPSSQHGTFTYAFRAFSRDGHQVTGQVSFTVGPVSASPSATASAAASPSTPAISPAAEPSNPAPSPAMASGDPSGIEGFWARHWWQVLVGALLFAAAGLLELTARRSRV